MQNSSDTKITLKEKDISRINGKFYINNQQSGRLMVQDGRY